MLAMQPKLGELNDKRTSDDHVIARVVTASARSKKIGLRDLSRKQMLKQGTALN
jgi:hypothetical protein